MTVNKFSKNVAMIFIARGADLLFSLVVIAVITRYLGVETYGKYSLLMAIVFVLTSFSRLGMAKILVRDIAQNRDAAGRLLGAGLIFSALMLIVVAAFVPIAVVIFDIEGVLATALPILIVAEVLQLFAGLFVAVFIAFERMEFDALFSVASRFLFIALLAIVVSLKLSLLYIFASLFIANLVGLLLVIILCRKYLGVKADFSNWKSPLKQLGMDVLPIGGAFIIFQLYQHVDVFVLLFVQGLEDVALFQAPYVLITKIQALGRIMIIAIAPIFARLVVTDKTLSLLGFVYSRLAKYTMVALLPVVIFGVLAGESIVTMFFGEEFIDSSIVLMIFIVGAPFIVIDLISDVTLVSIGKQKLLVISVSIGLVVNFILDIILGIYYGYTGAAIASLIALFFVFAINMYFVSTYVGSIDLGRMFLPFIVVGALLWGLTAALWPVSQLLAIGVAIVIYSACVVGLAFLWRGEMRKMASLQQN